jgi:hypothetical protein
MATRSIGFFFDVLNAGALLHHKHECFVSAYLAVRSCMLCQGKSDKLVAFCPASAEAAALGATL